MKDYKKIIQDPKAEYIIKTLSKTERKDYENYVINAIWNRLSNNNIKPITQQYVYNKDKNEHYYIDLYFPQINFGVEVDERHHLGREKIDKERTKAITSEFQKLIIKDGDQYIEERIVVYNKTFDEIEAQINNVVRKIKNKIEETEIKEWITDLKKFALENEKISIKDNIIFRTINETCNVLFNTNYKLNGGARSSYFLPRILSKNSRFKNTKLWFPNLAIEEEGTHIAAVHEWNNQLNNDGTIYEFGEKISEEVYENYEVAHENQEIRYVFIRSKDSLNRTGYRFVGKYQKTKWIAVEHAGKYLKAEYYERISEECPIVK